MATRFDALNDALSATTGIPAIITTTMMGWFYRNVDGGVDEVLLDAGDVSGSEVINVFVQATDDAIALYGGFGGGDPLRAQSSGIVFAVGTWRHIAVVITAQGGGADNQAILYVDGLPTIGVAVSSSCSAEVLRVARGNTNTERFRGRVAAVKIWNRVLNQTEIPREMRQYLPVNWGGLNRFTPLRTEADANDLGPAGNNWSVVGTLISEPGPPIPWKVPKRRVGKAAAATGNRRRRVLMGAV